MVSIGLSLSGLLSPLLAAIMRMPALRALHDPIATTTPGTAARKQQS